MPLELMASAIPRLALIRHSQPTLDFKVPSSTWCLSDEGRRRCLNILPTVENAAPAHIYTGPEPKMGETGSIIGVQLGISVTPVDELCEHRRPCLPERGQEEWHALIARLFDEPETLVLGHETAIDCLARFSRAIQKLAGQHSGESFAIVSGATAISLYVAHQHGVNAFDFWRKLEMPDVVVIDHPHS